MNMQRRRPLERCPSHAWKTKQVNTPSFDVPPALYGVLGVDLTEIHALGPALALKLIGECQALHYWLCVAPGNKISGGKVLSSRTRRSSSWAAALLRLAAISVGRSDTALPAFYPQLPSRASKAKAVTAAARKVADLFYNALRHGMSYKDPRADHYEQQYRSPVLTNLQRRAKSLGFVLQAFRQTPNRLSQEEVRGLLRRKRHGSSPSSRSTGRSRRWHGYAMRLECRGPASMLG
ncbi:hypothetical protein [Bradyrhizobium sp. 150]|uniref:hypothetical protein n=1 Tax=Bradyrhizobium sp. 150 TaxID=2782625 RepID=UPI001FF7B7ED|nr:hypothetical protein [Bradyrhizobium sp. 150]